MGGCCGCASKTTELHTAPPFFHYPVSEVSEPLSARHAVIPVLTTGLLVDTNLDTSSPDTYRPPSVPMPYEKYTVCPPASPEDQESSGNKTLMVLQTTNGDSANDMCPRSNLETEVKGQEVDEKPTMNTDQVASDKVDSELEKSVELFIPPLQDEEDACPTCFEEYDEENPKIITKCDHHFHLACILEWMERSDTCPVCDQEMVFSPDKG